MSYILATTENKVRWYKFTVLSPIKAGEYTLLDELIISDVPSFGDNATAKNAAQSLGLGGMSESELKRICELHL